MMICKKLKLPTKAIILLFVIFSHEKCSTIDPGNPPPVTGCTFIVSAPLNADCNIKHQTNPAPTGQRKINVLVQVEIKYLDRINGYSSLSHKEITTNLSSFPLQITDVRIPSNNTTPYDYYVTIVGQECTECAIGYGG